MLINKQIDNKLDAIGYNKVQRLASKNGIFNNNAIKHSITWSKCWISNIISTLKPCRLRLK